MDISIFEDQTGLKLYPVGRSEKDNKIVSFFNNNIDLYIEKIGNNLTTYCHLIAYKSSSRPLGYYLIYKDQYKENFFTSFRKDIDKIIQDLDLRPRTGHIDNLIFENIQKFDDKYLYNKEDTEAIIYSINHGRNLGFSSNIREISAFSNYILRNINSVKISIASSENELGNINFLIDKKDGDILKKNARTIQTINESKGILIEKKKSETGEPGRIKINEGLVKIKEGTEILKNAGYSETEIIREIDKKLCDSVPIYRKRMYEGTKTKVEIVEKEEKKSSYTKALVVFFGILVISAIVMYALYPEQVSEKLSSIKERYIISTPSTPPLPANTAVTETTSNPSNVGNTT